MAKVAGMLMDFFGSDDTTVSWFIARPSKELGFDRHNLVNNTFNRWYLIVL